MKKVASYLFFFLFFHSLIAQTITGYWISFTDKKNSPYSMGRPSLYLSEKAIERRERQHIPVTTSDLPVNPSYINEIKGFGVTVISRSKWLNAILISCPDADKIKAIKNLPYVKEVKTIMISSTIKESSKFESVNNTIPVEERSGIKHSSTTLNYGPSFYQANQIGVDCLHDLGFQGQGMVIAVLDAGFENVHLLPAFDSLRMNNQLLGTRDFVTGGTMVFEDHNHGMCVLSCMVGNLQGRIVGTAPKAKYWLLRTEDAATETLQEEINWLAGAEFADSVGADIINSSLGYNHFDGGVGDHTYSDLDGNTTIVTKAADWAASKGIFVVCSAGNSGGPPWYKITAPADADSVLTVGGVDSAGAIGAFSSRGLSFDGRIKPDVVSRGVQAVVASPGGDVFKQSGTSFSSPITAGAVACLWQANPAYTNMQILSAIQQSASQYSTPDSIMGYGIPNFCFANMLLSGIDVHRMNEEEKLNVFPNPFNSNFNIVFYSDKKQTIRFELFDISGRCIVVEEEKTMNANSYNKFNSFDGEALSVGVYILRVITSDKIYYKKLLKE